MGLGLLQTAFFCSLPGGNISFQEAKVFYENQKLIYKHREKTKRNGNGPYAAIHAHFGLTVATQQTTEKVFESVLIVKLDSFHRALSPSELDSSDPTMIWRKRHAARYHFPYQREGSQILKDHSVRPAIEACLKRMSDQAKQNVDPQRWAEMERATEDFTMANGRKVILRLVPGVPFVNGTVSNAKLEPFNNQVCAQTLSSCCM